jgi:hypothetical protein
MSKRPSEASDLGPSGKVARIVDSGNDVMVGVVKKSSVQRRPTIIYRPGQTLDCLMEHLTAGADGAAQKVEVRAPGQFVCSGNHKVRGRQLWGCDVYTSDSDLIAVLMHCGYLHHTIPSPLRDVAEVRAVIMPLPAQDSYQSVPRNSIRSRAWHSPFQGCSFSVEKAWVVTRSGNSYDLSSLLSSSGASQVMPTFTPGKQERMVTRSSVGHAGRQKASQEVTVVFSLSNDPWIKYSLQSVSDHGLKPHDRTSAKLKTSVLLLETQELRYELSRSEEADKEVYVFSKCNTILSCKEYKSAGVPLPKSMKKVIEDNLQWEEIRFGANAVWVREHSFPVLRIQFIPQE